MVKKIFLLAYDDVRTRGGITGSRFKRCKSETNTAAGIALDTSTCGAGKLCNNRRKLEYSSARNFYGADNDGVENI